MSASEHTITLREALENPEDEKDLPGFVCQSCGYKGQGGELLLDADGDDDTMWCPNCKTAGWVWA